MKAALYMTCIASGILSFLMIHLHFAYQSPSVGKIISATPKKELKELKAPQINRGSDLPKLSSLWQKNLFDPSRGGHDDEGKKDEPNSRERSELELVGICKFGSYAGAIISIKNASQKAARQPLKPGEKKPNTAEKPTKARKYYKQGERVGNGYLLSKINDDSVVLSRDNEEVVLKMEYADTHSIKRIAKTEESKNEKMPETPGDKDKKRKLPGPPLPPPMKTAQIQRDNGKVL
ncbi:MAG: hypothetical protein A2020_11140 [Lentisphaerae bacterium GWF2_45_14]|nr:MAG: hypothetical protein A2020_11140 [Lentisphaerae bacterium GWF2_45_14]